MHNTPRAILDTSALISLYELDLMQYLNLMYVDVLIPDAVEKEFLDNPRITEEEKTKRLEYFFRITTEYSSWLQQCKEYEDTLIQLYLAMDGMDQGEAETLAQNQSLDSLFEVIIDERTARKMARSASMQVHGTLYLIAKLHIQFQVCDYWEYTRKMKEETTTHVTDKIIELVFSEVEWELL